MGYPRARGTNYYSPISVSTGVVETASSVGQRLDTLSQTNQTFVCCVEEESSPVLELMALNHLPPSSHESYL